MDEIKGRKIARDIYKLHVIGTGRILVEAKRAGLISEVRPFLQRMRGNGFWLSDRIVAEIVHQAGE
jgi:predicted nucleic acid-binding protein